MGLLRNVLRGASAVLPALAASQGRFGEAARGLQTGLSLAAPFLGSGAGAGGMSLVASPGGARIAPAGPGVMKIGGGIFAPGGIASPIPSMGATQSQQVKMVLSLAGQALDLRNREGEPRAMRKREFIGLIRAVGIHEASEIMQQAVGTVALVWMFLRRRRARGISARDIRKVHQAKRIVSRARRLASTFGGGGGRRRGAARRPALLSGATLVRQG